MLSSQALALNFQSDNPKLYQELPSFKIQRENLSPWASFLLSVAGCWR